MSKTLGSILTIAGSAALIASGVGAAAGLALFGTTAGISVAGISTAALLTASTALVAAGSLISGLGTKAPKAETTSTAIKTERPPRFSAYGRVKMFGAYILYETAPDGTAVDAWAFHEGRIDAIEGWYLGDKLVTRLSNGFVARGEDGAYGASDVIQIGANLGATPGTAHAALVGKVPDAWTTYHRGDGVVTGYMISKPVKAKYFQEVYPAGGPNQTPLAIVIRAQPVFDWRDPSQVLADALTWKWSENAWLHIAHYELVRNGKSWERHFLPTLSFWTAAVDDADLAVPLKAGGSEPRYRSCVSHRHAGDGSEHKAVLAALLGCCDGWLAPRQDGALVPRAGRYYAPTVSIGPDVIVAYSVDDGIEDENAVNQIGVTYVSAAHDYNTVDTDAWTDEADILARGAIRSDDLTNQVPSHAQARRLAKRRMAQAMAMKRGTFVTTSAGATILGERYIDLLLAEGIGTEHEFVAYDGPVEITQLSRNLQTGAVSASWIAADPNIDAWNPATEEGDPAPAGERIAREPLEPPVIAQISSRFDQSGTTGGSDQTGAVTGVRLQIVAAGPIRDDLDWYVRWRVDSSGAWDEQGYEDVNSGPGVSLVTGFVPSVEQLEVQIAYSVGDGRISPYSPSRIITTNAVVLSTEDGMSLTTEDGSSFSKE